MKKKRLLSWVMSCIMCLSFIVPYGEVGAMTVLEADVEAASDGCTMLGVYGSYYTQAQDALDRINEIRKEACDAGNVPDPNNPSRMLTSDDYVPVKWSKDLESIARIRAAEGGLAFSFLSSGHNRLNGKGTFSVQYNGVQSWAEDLAYNWGTSMVSGINQWYEEKSDWVNQASGAVTGHYTSMINPKFAYVGLGDFYTKEATYPNTLAGEFCYGSQTLDESMQPAQTDVMQKVEVSNSYITGYVLEGGSTIDKGKTEELTLKANLVNGSKAHKLWVIDPVTYTSSDPSVAQVTDTGVVTGLNAGTVTITVRSGDSVLVESLITIVPEEPGIAPGATETPSAAPEATVTPSIEPTAVPTEAPSAAPEATVTPSIEPTAVPTEVPGAAPETTVTPSIEPTTVPTEAPGAVPEATVTPSVEPTEVPSAVPEVSPTAVPTEKPGVTPSVKPAVPKVNAGKKVSVNGINYKVTSVKGTLAVECTGAKENTKNIVIPSAVKINGKNYKVTAIAKDGFKGNKKITKVTIGANIKKIGKNAFYNCKNLKNIVIKTKRLTLKAIGKNAFKGISIKVTIKVPAGKVNVYSRLMKAAGAGKNVKVVQ